MIVLVGFMGAGKTTVGHILAERLGTPFVDSDVHTTVSYAAHVAHIDRRFVILVMLTSGG